MTKCYAANDAAGSVMWHCPGCGNAHCVTTKARNQCGAQWSWNGDLFKPTISPSVVAGNTCHCFVESGNIRFLSDCVHSLKGQTVPMVDWDS